MNKAELVASMASKSGLSQKDSAKALQSFIESVQDALKKRDKVSLVGFGTFEVKVRAARKGRNPQTKKEILIPETKTPAFKVSKAFKDLL